MRQIRSTGKVSLAVEDQIVLACAGTASRRGAERVHVSRLAGEVDWALLAGGLRARRLLPALGPRVLELLAGDVDEGFSAEVSRSIEAGRLRATALALVSARAIGALADAGVAATALKGSVLGQAIYGDPGRRSFDDVDVLVDPSQLHQAVEVVRGLGYAAPEDPVDARGLPLLHFALVHERQELPTIELHWRIHWYEERFARERLLAPIGDAATGEWRPALVDELASLLLFYARDGFIGLRLASDVSAWWDAFGPSLPGGSFSELLECYPPLRRALLTALAVAERVIGLPAAQILGCSRPKLARRQRLARRLADPNPRGSEAQLFADMGLVDGLLAPRGGLVAFLRRQVLLPRSVLARRANDSQARAAASPFAHAARVLTRYALAITRVLLTPASLTST